MAPAAETAPHDEGKFECRECGHLLRSEFSPSSLKSAIHICKQCTKIKNQKYFQRAKESTIKDWRIRQRVSGKFQLGKKELDDIFAAYGGRACFITSLKNVPLTLIRADPARDYTADNAVPVMARLASALDNLPDELLVRWRKQFGTTAAEPAATAAGERAPAATAAGERAPAATTAAGEQAPAATTAGEQAQATTTVRLLMTKGQSPGLKRMCCEAAIAPAAKAEEQPLGAEPEQQQHEPAAPPQPTAPLATAKEQLPAAKRAAAMEQPPAALPFDKQPERAVLLHNTLSAAAKEQQLAATLLDKQPERAVLQHNALSAAAKEQQLAAALLDYKPNRAALFAELRRGLLTKGESPGLKRKREAEAASAQYQ